MLYLLILLLFALTSCVSSQSNNQPDSQTGTEKKAPAKISSDAKKEVAIVSFAVNNYGAMYGQGAIDPVLIKENMNILLSETEEILERYWKVKPVKSFAHEASYFDLSIGKTRQGLFAPEIAGRSMPTFTDKRNDVVKGNLSPEIAKELCKALNVDAVVLYYSEWTLDSGKFVPTIKALTKNCVSMYDGKGKKLFYKRKDIRGSKTIGSAFSPVHINEDTIENWVEASLKGLEFIFSKVKI